MIFYTEAYFPDQKNLFLPCC